MPIINLKEWDECIKKELYLDNDKDRELAKRLCDKRILEIKELREGLFVKSNSKIGSFSIGSLQINISPKIEGIELYKLLSYVYDFSNINLFNKSKYLINKLSFFDILVYQLYIEVKTLIQGGLQKNYIKKEDKLSSIRGRIDINKISLEGGIIKEKLPCKYFNREEDNILNQILLSGLILAFNLVKDKELKYNIQGIIKSLERDINLINLNNKILKSGFNSINRLNNRYINAFNIISILYNSKGIDLGEEDNYKNIDLSGYFFDMNLFFERLIGKLLVNCIKDYEIKTQYSLKSMFSYNPLFNPKNKKSSSPRPDFVLMKNGKIIKILDAKYRDLFETNLPRDMLYQLSIYALSGVGDKSATIIYPTTNNKAKIQKIDINNTIIGDKIGEVVLKSVNLNKISSLVCNNDKKSELKKYINDILLN